MKPFTLEWWLSVLKKYNSESSKEYNTPPERLGFRNKARWVKNRIINKYGE